MFLNGSQGIGILYQKSTEKNACSVDAFFSFNLVFPSLREMQIQMKWPNRDTYTYESIHYRNVNNHVLCNNLKFKDSLYIQASEKYNVISCFFL